MQLHRIAPGRFASVGLAPRSTSCLTPPGTGGGGVPGKPSQPETMTTAAPDLGDFSRNSAELLTTARLGWNLGNSLDVPAGETGWANRVYRPKMMEAPLRAATRSDALKDVALAVPGR